MAGATSELVYTLNLYEVILSQNGPEEDLNTCIGYARDLMRIVDFIFECPGIGYMPDEDTHNTIMDLGRKYL